MRVLKIDHVQLAMPPGEEQRAREFYEKILGLSVQEKPENLTTRGGVWFTNGSLKVHLGVETDFRPSRKAHPAFRVEGLAQLRNKCEDAGYPTVDDEPLAGFQRFYVSDPFGNRIEFLERA